MINREILYERNLTGSYMKIPVALNAKFDEKIMLKRKLPGLLPIERCYVNGHGQYWYNITGKQSLDTYCKVRSIGIDFIERMIISICNELEILEWNLLDINSLMLDPELVFVTNQNGEIIFTIYPGEHTMLSMEFQQLMEYMLTKIDHSDMDAVHAAYAIYEKTLDDTYSIVDIRDMIVSKKEKCVDAAILHTQVNEQKNGIKSSEKNSLHNAYELDEDHDKQEGIDAKEKKSFLQKIEALLLKSDAISRSIESIKKYINECKTKRSSIDDIKEYKSKRNGIDDIKEYKSKRNSIGDRKQNNKRWNKKKIPDNEQLWITPDIEDYNDEPDIIIQDNPTVCLRNYVARPRGVLLYDGADEFENISLAGNTIRLGKAVDADVMIDKETISKFHAKIEQHNKEFYIEDLNSTNGTTVNGEALSYKERRKLEINDIVQLADVRYRFV